LVNRSRSLALLVVVIVGSLIGAGSAQAVTIGSDLSATANVAFSFPDAMVVASGGGAVAVPADGVLTTWRLKYMDVHEHSAGTELNLVVLNGNTLDAVDAEHMPVATEPNVQHIVEFHTSLPVHAGERLGIEVPTQCDCEFMQIDGVNKSDFWVPPLTLGQSAAPKYSEQEPTPILNADIGPPSTPSGPTGTSGGGAPSTGDTKLNGQVVFENGGPSIKLATDTKNGFFTSPAKCELPPGSPLKCTGAVVFVGFGPGSSPGPGATPSAKAKKAPAYGSVNFSLSPGESKKIKVPLKKAAKATLARQGKLTGKLTTSTTLASGAASSLTQKLTLKLKQG
jgi:hypothetical protein